MKKESSPNKRPGDDDQPITIRINVVIQERPPHSGRSTSANPRRNRASSGSAPLAGGAPSKDTDPHSRHSMLSGPAKSQPAHSPAPILEGTLDRNRLKDLLKSKQSADSRTAANAEPDIEITLVVYV